MADPYLTKTADTMVLTESMQYYGSLAKPMPRRQLMNFKWSLKENIYRSDGNQHRKRIPRTK